jgi:hypothetical protein
VSPEELAVIGGVDAHTGNPVIPAVDFEFGANGTPPTDIAETPPTYRAPPRRHFDQFATAATYFASSDPSDGVAAAFAGADELLIVDPEFLLLGLTVTALGL